MKKSSVLIVLFLGVLLSCNSNKKKEEKLAFIDFSIKNLSDIQYPDNPDIGFRAKDYKSNFFTKGEIQVLDTLKNTINIQFQTNTKDTIAFKNLDLSEFIPTIPEAIKTDTYLSAISCVNQEWNRNQVNFKGQEFYSNDKKIVRADIARNCLNAYLWEIILYAKEGDKVLPYAHGWFDFPHDLYATLFGKDNNIAFKTYKNALVNWVEPESKSVDFSQLRTIIKSINIKVSDSSNMMYPLTGARKKKFKEIIYPKSFKTMKDLQTDSTLLATFTPPGYYNKKDPRPTELGRFYNLRGAKLYSVKSKINGAVLHELDLSFKHKNGDKVTNLILGGLDFNKFPVLTSGQDANNGWKSSMGIGNHPFYEPYKAHNALKEKYNPYYAILIDKDGRWLDSHKLAIDGPIFYFSDTDRTILHLWLLSFERHALVGHYVIKLKKE